jgi:hypothetical protein
MIRHVVLFKLNEGVTPEDPSVVAAVKTFSHLGDEIPEVQSWEVGWNITDRPIAYDFPTRASLPTARRCGGTSSTRLIGRAWSWSEFATWVIADYEF